MSQARILVVDDEPDTLGLIELTLQTAGFSVRTAANGDQALAILLNDTFDLVLLDIMMPGMTGFDLLEILRNREVKTPPIVFLTAKSRQEDREKGATLGAAGFLTKPTTRGELLDTIRSVIGE
jgi:DNA-binding response OmpR family regulator